MTALADATGYFLSHAGADKDLAKNVAIRIQLAGRESFLDEWSIEYGESIPGAISSALRAYGVVVLFWSAHASASSWVRREFNSAVSRFVDDADRSLVVVRLDDTEVPELIRDLKWVDGRSGDTNHIADALLGFDERDKFRAIQKQFESMKLKARNFEGYGVAIACPMCGAGFAALKEYFEPEGDGETDWAGVECMECGWKGFSALHNG